MGDSRFLVLVLDGLRPDLVTGRDMPNLADFRDRGASLKLSKAQFPTHTRVNKTSFTSGSTPKHHGVHFNKIFDPTLLPDQFIDLGDHADVSRADAAGRLITATTIGQALRDAERQFALVHCGMSGAPWLLNYRGDRIGQEHISMAGYPHSTAEAARLVSAGMGDMPDTKGISHARSRFAFDAFRTVLYPGLKPQVGLIWSDEPDKSLHVDGLRGPVSRAAFQHIDTLVGDVVAWWRSLADKDDLNLIIMSDHGHVETVGGYPVGELMKSAGLPVTTDVAGEGAVLLPFGSGGLYLRDQPRQVLFDVVEWMQRQDWIGNLFTADLDGVNGVVPGTLSTALASIDHPRAPDLFFTLRRLAAAPDEFPFGRALDPTGRGSTHGGLHNEELTNICFAAGPAFKERYRSDTAGGIVDITPTILSVLGIEKPPTMVGRALGDLLADGVAPPDAHAEARDFTATAGAYSQTLRLRQLAGRNLALDATRD
ncbi:alkaline phosphatase family protein [Devosia sp. PTR5]|uniref:Alkaline phosphatase family protein n=1 Tax=Devosia oryzisoli TaxID=2774138 RepID=A0A927FTG3_9HYPH|nr:alkaline phosphatase family protein [Devosia oryzisoli]MBD8065965.1 alkaline phosphatase family protein [Devosia oryzisoli]